MKIHLLLFGSLRESVGESRLEVELSEGATLADVRAWLAGRSDLVDKLGDRLAASINMEVADLSDVVEDGDEVAFLPPVAGGDGTTRSCTISESPLDEAEVETEDAYFELRHALVANFKYQTQRDAIQWLR